MTTKNVPARSKVMQLTDARNPLHGFTVQENLTRQSRGDTGQIVLHKGIQGQNRHKKPARQSATRHFRRDGVGRRIFCGVVQEEKDGAVFDVAVYSYI